LAAARFGAAAFFLSEYLRRLLSRRSALQSASVIDSIAFRNFKALRDARVDLGPFNLVLGPNGSGKTSLIESLLHLRTLSKLAPVNAPETWASQDSPAMSFRFTAPYQDIRVHLGCVDDVVCDALRVDPIDAEGWSRLRVELMRIRYHVFDHRLMALPVPRRESVELDVDGGNLAAVLLTLQEQSPTIFAALATEVVRLFPEFSRMEVQLRPDDRVALAFSLAGGAGIVDGGDLSQGMLYILGLLTLAFLPEPPSVLCIEEVDRGIHPRMLREVRDILYRLSFPESAGLSKKPVQVIATTHSPYLLDLFRDHPEEIILTQKHGTAAHFERLSQRTDIGALLAEGALGDLWFSGILGGIPESSTKASESGFQI
jgi:predicted ATPase